MPDTSKGESKEPKSLEMRVAELEDKLAKVHISEDEMKAFQKVSSLLGANPSAGTVAEGAAAAAGCVNECVIRQPIIRQPIIRQCIINQCIISQPIIRQPIIRQCTWECFECGGGAPGGGWGSLGGFGTLGS